MSGVEATFRLMTQRSVLIGVTLALLAGSMTSLPWGLNFVGLCLSIVIAGYAVVFSIALRTVLSGEDNKSRRRVALDRWVFARLFLAYPAYRFLLAAINVGLSLYYFDVCFPGSLFEPHEFAVNSATYLWFVFEHLSTKAMQLTGSEADLPESWRAPLKISTSTQLAAVAFVAMNLVAITPVAHLLLTWMRALGDAFRHGGTVEEDTALGIADIEGERDRTRERERPYEQIRRPFSLETAVYMEAPAYGLPFRGLLTLLLIVAVIGGVGYLFVPRYAEVDWLLNWIGRILISVVIVFLVLLVSAVFATVTDSPEDNAP